MVSGGGVVGAQPRLSSAAHLEPGHRRALSGRGVHLAECHSADSPHFAEKDP